MENLILSQMDTSGPPLTARRRCSTHLTSVAAIWAVEKKVIPKCMFRYHLQCNLHCAGFPDFDVLVPSLPPPMCFYILQHTVALPRVSVPFGPGRRGNHAGVPPTADQHIISRAADTPRWILAAAGSRTSSPAGIPPLEPLWGFVLGTTPARHETADKNTTAIGLFRSHIDDHSMTLFWGPGREFVYTVLSYS